MIQEKRYDEAISFFGRKLTKDHPLFNFGYAAAVLTRDGAGLDIKRTNELIDLFEGSMDAIPNFAEAHRLCGIAYLQLGGAWFKKYNGRACSSDQEQIEDIREEIRNAFERSREYLEKAAELCPDMAESVRAEIEKNQPTVQFIEQCIKKGEVVKPSPN